MSNTLALHGMETMVDSYTIFLASCIMQYFIISLGNPE